MKQLKEIAKEEREVRYFLPLSPREPSDRFIRTKTPGTHKCNVLLGDSIHSLSDITGLGCLKIPSRPVVLDQGPNVATL